jgi:iron(III) transport system substrate-binding protein
MGTRAGAVLGIAVLLAALPSCSSGTKSTSTSLTMYTSATQNVEEAVIAGFQKAHPGVHVNVFRAPTGQLNARVAADVRSGGIQADVLWPSDPLTMHGYDKQGLLAPWQPSESDIPAAYRTPDFAGVDLLYMVVVVHKGTPAPRSWADLANPRYRGQVVIPDPTFAASALGLLGYFAQRPDYGVAFYRQLKANGAKQVSAPGDALTAVEQGSAKVGITLANTAYVDAQKGSPISVVWPQPGGVKIYAPIGITTKKNRSTLAAQFANYVASPAAQAIMAKLDTYVVVPGVGGPPLPAGSPVTAPNWTSLFNIYPKVLAQYAAIFGG